MKQLLNFDLSIVIPLGDWLDTFVDGLPSWTVYYERNGIEVILLVDGGTEYRNLLDCIREYPFISWKVVVASASRPWHNWAEACNEGIRKATKAYILFMYPEFDFQTDIIYELRKDLDDYPAHYATGSSYDSLLVKKEHLDLVDGYDKRFNSREGSEENLCRRLELAGIRRLYISNTMLQNKESRLSETWQRDIQGEVLSEMLLPMHIKAENVSAKEFGIVVYDWQKHPYAEEQCREYLSGLKQYDIPTDVVFEKTYPLIALVPTYNESERITDCLRSVEKYCDGIILLDDDSRDDTYEIARSDKLLLKARKVRTEFNDKENRSILLDLASFFKAEWFIFIDADERFDDRFVDLREIMKRPDVDTVGVWIANLWDNENTYRVNIGMSNFIFKQGLWLRWRMFRNQGRMKFLMSNKLHFKSVPYLGRLYVACTLLLHYGYLTPGIRRKKYLMYKIEDKNNLLDYNEILDGEIQYGKVENITLDSFKINHVL